MSGDELDLAAQLADARALEADLRPAVTPDPATGEISGQHWDVEEMIEVNQRIRALQAAMGLELDPLFDGEQLRLEALDRYLFVGEPEPEPTTSTDGAGFHPESLGLEGLRRQFSEPVPEPAPLATPEPDPPPPPDEVPVWKRPVVLIGVAVTVLVVGAALSLFGGDDEDADVAADGAGDTTAAIPEAPSTTAAPTTTTTAPAAPAAATPVAPAATLEAVLSPPSTLYTIRIGDDVDAYDYDWSATEVSCGEFVIGSGGRAQWDHPTAEGGCTHVAPDHPGTISVRATRGDGATFSCTYTGGSTAGSVACVGG